jgi:hypothetical protein
MIPPIILRSKRITAFLRSPMHWRTPGISLYLRSTALCTSSKSFGIQLQAVSDVASLPIPCTLEKINERKGSLKEEKWWRRNVMKLLS